MKLILGFTFFVILSMELVAQNGSMVIRVDGGLIEGISTSDSSVRVFLGIPYAAPPTGALRWRPPRPVAAWEGVRSAKSFGHRAMQQRPYGDMIFRDTMSEDCLYLNVWTPARNDDERLPVMVWIHGGGFIAGSSSEPRQDGENLSRKGVVVVSMNYRLGIFGFLSHPDLARESPVHASGNYGLLDQVAALGWVQRNIVRFGGDPNNVTIFGESAGSLSVCALIASPLTERLFRKAIGESGGYFGRRPLELQESMKIGEGIASKLGSQSIDELRKLPAGDILDVTPNEWPSISTNIDGLCLTEQPESTYTHGRQRSVPLLAGWNADEGKMAALLSPRKTTAGSFTDRAQSLFDGDAKQFLSFYPAGNDEEALRSASVFEGDKFMGYSTWKWIDLQSKTGSSSVYRYSFDQTPLVPSGAEVAGIPLEKFGARHACEIEYVFGTFPLTGVEWKENDRKLSDLIGTYWTNFAKSGDPNGPGLPSWPVYHSDDAYRAMHLTGRASGARPETDRARLEFLGSHRQWEKEP